jgi:hypothetical protein
MNVAIPLKLDKESKEIQISAYIQSRTVKHINLDPIFILRQHPQQRHRI